MAKYRYELIINKELKKYREYAFNFGQTKDITISVAKSSLKISVTMGTAKQPEEIISSRNYLFSDAIKKAMLLHLIQYSENLPIKTLQVRINGEEKQFTYDKGRPPVYSLTPGQLLRKFPESWQNDALFKNILDQTKSSHGPLMASLYALICSKSKHYETERFVYLWMSMNGLYSHLTELAKPFVPPDKTLGDSEKAKIERFLRINQLGRETPSRGDSVFIAQKVIAALRRYNAPLQPEIFKEPACQSNIRGQIEELIMSETGRKYDIEAGAYLMMGLGYHFRCNMIHSNKPLPLFSYADEDQLSYLRTVSNLLEEYLDNHLYRLFDEGYVDTQIMPEIRKIIDEIPPPNKNKGKQQLNVDKKTS